MVKKFVLLIAVLLACGSTVLAMAPAAPAAGADNHAAPELCPLCHERNLNDGDEMAPVRELPCHHRFCQACIDNWEHGLAHPWCPVCHADIEQPVAQNNPVFLDPDALLWAIFFKYGGLENFGLEQARVAVHNGADDQAIIAAVSQFLRRSAAMAAADHDVPGILDDVACYQLACVRNQFWRACFYKARARARFLEALGGVFASAQALGDVCGGFKVFNAFWHLPMIRRYVPLGSCVHNAVAACLLAHNTALVPRQRNWSQVANILAHAGAAGLSLYDIRHRQPQPSRILKMVNGLAGCVAAVSGFTAATVQQGLAVKHETHPTRVTYFAKWVSPLVLSLYVGHRLDGIRAGS